MTQKVLFIIFFIICNLFSRDEFDYIDSKISYVSNIVDFQSNLTAYSNQYTILIVYLNESKALEIMSRIYNKINDLYSPQGISFFRVYATTNGLLDELKSLDIANSQFNQFSSLPALFVIAKNEILASPLEGIYTFQEVQEYIRDIIGIN